MKRILQIMIILVIVVSGIGSAGTLALASQTNPDGGAEAKATSFPSIFLPIIQRFGGSWTVTGQVIDEAKAPIQNVLIADTAGHSALTDSSGRYRLENVPAGSGLAATKAGYVFTPSMRLLTPEENPRGFNFIASRQAVEMIVNGNFETREDKNVVGWTFYTNVYGEADLPVYYNDTFGNHFMRTGGGKGISEIRQAVTLPDNVTNAVLSMKLLPVIGAPGLAANAMPEAVEPSANWMEKEAAPEAADNDLQYVRILNENGQELDFPYAALTNEGPGFGPQLQFSLSEFAGRRIIIAIGAYNNGTGNAAYLFVDDVSLLVDTGAAPTPTPGTCDNGLVNSSFERTGSWVIPITEYSAGYSTAVAHKGDRSLRTGITDRVNNRNSYSSAWQNVTIPKDIDHAMLRGWVYTQVDSTLAADSEGNQPASPGAQPAFRPTFPQEASNLPESAEVDAQIVRILDPDTNHVLKWVYNTTGSVSNKRAWEFIEANLMDFRGETIRVEIVTTNNGSGNAVAMFADEIVVELCDLSVAPTPTPTQPPTTTPACNIDAIVNNGFEKDTGWRIPVTAFSAGYTTEKEYAGAWSMRSGIPYSQYNRYSYSDFYQVVSIPDDWDKAKLRFWWYPKSTAPVALTGSDAESFSASMMENSNLDLQYVLVLDQWGNWIDTLMWERSNLKAWTAFEDTLNGYIGETIRLQWGVYNNGFDGVTTMWVDNVELTPCP